MNVFESAMREQIVTGQPPRMIAGARKAKSPGATRPKPLFAMMAFGLLAASVLPSQAQASSSNDRALRDAADTARDISNIYRSGERARNSVGRVGEQGGVDGMLRSIERALRDMDNAQRQTERARERQERRQGSNLNDPGFGPR